MSDRILSFTSSLLEKTQDFRYFGLLFSFCLILDSALFIHLESSLMQFKLSDFGAKVNIGNFILFLASFSFILAFVVPVIKQFLTYFFLFTSFWKINELFFPPEKYDPTIKDHYLSFSEIKAFAIKEDNKVAYEMYLNEVNSIRSYNNLCLICLTLLVAFLINFSITFNSEYTIGNYIYTLISPDTFTESILAILVIILLFYCTYLGVIICCGLNSTDLRKVYIYKHGLNKET